LTDFHNYGRKLEKTLAMIQREDFPPADKKLITDFLEHCGAQGMSIGRLYKLAWTLLSVKRRFPPRAKGVSRESFLSSARYTDESGKE
jgi:hypothetical protein